MIVMIFLNIVAKVSSEIFQQISKMECFFFVTKYTANVVYLVCMYTSHSAYIATSTESYIFGIY